MVFKWTVEVSWDKLYLGIHEDLGYIPFECQGFTVFSESSITLTLVSQYLSVSY